MLPGLGVTWTRCYPDKVLSGRYYLDKNSCYLDKVLSGQGVTWTRIDVTWTRCYLDKVLPDKVLSGQQ